MRLDIIALARSSELYRTAQRPSRVGIDKILLGPNFDRDVLLEQISFKCFDCLGRNPISKIDFAATNKMTKLASEATESQPLIKKETPESSGTAAAAIADDIEARGSKSAAPTTKSTETVLEDAIDILKLAIPIFITSFSWVGVSHL